jgi:hypothetical protein
MCFVSAKHVVIVRGITWTEHTVKAVANVAGIQEIPGVNLKSATSS